jgi:hypothetical protein
MKTGSRCAALLFFVLLAVSSPAQPFSFGEPRPLTNARYAPARGYAPTVVSNTREPIVFWSDKSLVRVARIVDGQATVSRVVLQVSEDEIPFDVIWNGSHFVVFGMVGIETPVGPIPVVVARLVSAAAEPLGNPFDVVQQVSRNPRVAFNGEHILMLYNANQSEDVSAILLSPDGRPVESAPHSLGIANRGRVALTSNGSGFAAIVPRDHDPHVVLFDAAGHVTSDKILGAYGRGVSIASDGRHYLAVAACAPREPCGPTYARTVETDGSLGASIVVEPSMAQLPSSIWNGSEWVIGYAREALSGMTFHLVRLDAAAHALSRREERDGIVGSLAMIEGRALLASVGQRELDRISVLPLDSASNLAAAITATRQKLLSTASSSDSTLIVWQETTADATTLHAGVRSRDGSWRERMIESVAAPECCETLTALAASNGQEFMLVASDADQQLHAMRFDLAGEPIGEPVPVGRLAAEGLLWNGREYLLALESTRIAHLGTSGRLAEPVTIPAIGDQDAVFASDGNGNLLAVWIVHLLLGDNHRPLGLAGIHLGPDLQPLDAAPLTVSTDIRTESPSVAWDGRQYAVAWSGDDVDAQRRATFLAHVPASGSVAIRRPIVYDENNGPGWTHLTRVQGGAALLWRSNAFDALPFTNFIAILHEDGTVSESEYVSEGFVEDAVAALPDGSLAYVQSTESFDAPYQRIERVLMTVASPSALPLLPGAPAARRELQGATVIFAWDAPPQPVQGYRVELRRGDDGPWVETDSIRRPEERSIEVAVKRGQSCAVRVRAWNDAGIGPYSTPVEVNAQRHRAVRK